VATTHVSTLSTQLEAAKLETDSIQRQAAELSEQLEAVKVREASLKDGMAKREKDIKAEKQTAKERLERERWSTISRQRWRDRDSRRMR
jgi:hypothetical protein